jgi:methionyl-tRNA formyltransferase
LANDEKTIEVSVFKLDTTIDAGLVIRDETMPILPERSMNDVYWLITECADKLFILTIQNIDNNRATYQPPPGPESHYPIVRSVGKRFS